MLEALLGKFNFASCLDTMIHYLRHMAELATHISHGDLRHEVDPRSEHDILGKAFSHMSVYLGEMASIAMAITEGICAMKFNLKTNMMC